MSYPPHSVPSSASSPSALATFVAQELRSTFAEEQAIISYLLSTSSAPIEQQQQPPPQQPQGPSPEVADTLAKRSTRSLRNAPTYHLTFSLFTSGAAPSSWDIEAAIDEYMRPLLDVLGPIHNFTMDAQVQFYAPPACSPRCSARRTSRLSSTRPSGPSPPRSAAPLRSTSSCTSATRPSACRVVMAAGPTRRPRAGTSQSWLIPQWGAVYLLPLAPDQGHIGLAALKQPLLTFTSHLLSLLGTPESGSLPLRLSTLSRVRSADLLLRASSTLGSLARLSLALPSISIPSSVADGVASTMRHLRLACDSLGGADGLAHARIAEAEAEKAFFEKSMVGQLYFPDEHKVAVYLPLLGPVGVPLVMGLLGEIKAWRRRRRKEAEAAAAAAAAAATDGKKKQ